MLAKSWRRIKNNILLYKSGTEGFANSGLEPYSEYYASQIAKTMDLHYVDYGLSKWKGKLCSTCLLFTNENISYIPVGRIIKTGGIELLDMLVFDAVILNEDRHFGNFGFLIDNKSNKIVGCAPIFDNGLSLLCYAMDDDFKNIDQYIQTRLPATYQDFIAFVKPRMTKRQKEKLRKLIGFKFKSHYKYRLPRKRLKYLEEIIQKRVLELLE